MPIVSEKEISGTLKLRRLNGLSIKLTRGAMNILKIDAINAIYDKHSHLEGLEFVDAILNDLDISISIPEKDKKRIPANGPFILVGNHPLGMIDGLIMTKILLSHRPDARIMANFLLSRVLPINPYILPVNPFEDHKGAFSSMTGFRTALRLLSQGTPIGIFPAGEVSVLRAGKIRDKAWELSAVKLIKAAGVPVIPVYFHSKNSNLFYLLAGIHKNLRTAALPAELFKSKHKTVHTRIGNPISVLEQQKMEDIRDFRNYLMRKTYMLEYAFVSSKNRLKLPRPLKSVLRPTPAFLPSPVNIAHEIATLKSEGKMLFSAGDYEVYCSKLSHFHGTMQELGRLRELTFRAVGEGTHESLDLDRYDNYYHHLILWDSKTQKIGGAYRLGMGDEIEKKYGIRGFYTSELFHLSERMGPVLSQSIEMGRAFLSEDYHQKPIPLFLLWKGIVQVAKSNPDIRFLFGSASISSAYSLYCRSAMVYYLSNNHLDTYLSKFVSPRKKFRSMLKPEDKIWLDDLNLEKLDQMISEIEPQGLKIPVLIKKYLLQNAKCLGFNVDPAFSNAIDVLMYISLENLDFAKIER